MGVVVFWKLPFSREVRKHQIPWEIEKHGHFPKGMHQTFEACLVVGKVYHIHIICSHANMQIWLYVLETCNGDRWFGSSAWTFNLGDINMVLGRRSFPLGWFVCSQACGYAGFGKVYQGRIDWFCMFLPILPLGSRCSWLSKPSPWPYRQQFDSFVPIVWRLFSKTILGGRDNWAQLRLPVSSCRLLHVP